MTNSKICRCCGKETNRYYIWGTAKPAQTTQIETIMCEECYQKRFEEETK